MTDEMVNAYKEQVRKASNGQRFQTLSAYHAARREAMSHVTTAFELFGAMTDHERQAFYGSIGNWMKRLRPANPTTKGIKPMETKTSLTGDTRDTSLTARYMQWAETHAHVTSDEEIAYWAGTTDGAPFWPRKRLTDERGYIFTRDETGFVIERPVKNDPLFQALIGLGLSEALAIEAINQRDARK